jgi:signal transduction histidine kinase
MQGVAAGLVVAWAASGLILFTRPHSHRIGIAVTGAAVLSGACLLTEAGVTAGWTGAPRAAALVVEPLTAALLCGVGFHLLLSLPTGSVGSSGRRTVVTGAYAVSLASGAAVAATNGLTPGWVVAVISLAAVGLGLVPAHQRYRATAGIDRQRLQWLGCAAALVVEAVLVLVVFRLLLGWPNRTATMALAAATTVLIPLALTFGAFTSSLGRPDQLLVRTVSLAGITCCVAAVYVVLVLGLGRPPSSSDKDVFLLAIVAGGVTAALYHTAEVRLGSFAQRIVYGERPVPGELVRTFGTGLSRAISTDEVLLQLVESLRKTMSLRAAELWTGTNGRLQCTVCVPDRTPLGISLSAEEVAVVARAAVVGSAWLSVWVPSLLDGRQDSQLRVAPLTHSGELLGLLVAERPSGANLFTEEHDQVLGELAHQVGLALHNVQLDSALQATLDEVRRQAAEVQASRARIVAAGDAERRRIERDLHDGAQQRLVAMAVNLRLARDMPTSTADETHQVLDTLAREVQATIQELRDLAHGIYPPLLADSGLPAALRAAAARSPLAVEIACRNVSRYPPGVEAAVYFCCLEALQNAAKHAPGAQVAISIEERDGQLRFTIADDGPGFDASTASHGHGFDNMSDRLGAFGGSVRWESVPAHGTTVYGMVPVGQ